MGPRLSLQSKLAFDNLAGELVNRSGVIAAYLSQVNLIGRGWLLVVNASCVQRT